MRLLCFFSPPIMLSPNVPYYVRLCFSMFRLLFRFFSTLVIIYNMLHNPIILPPFPHVISTLSLSSFSQFTTTFFTFLFLFCNLLHVLLTPFVFSKFLEPFSRTSSFSKILLHFSLELPTCCHERILSISLEDHLCLNSFMCSLY